MDNSTRLLGFVSDIHAGSTRGLMPPGLVSAEGNPIGMNPFQEWLYQCWQDQQGWLAGIVGRDKYDLVFNGDLTEGKHHGARQLISNDTGDHIDPATKLLKPVAALAAKTFVVKGTECHSEDMEHVIAEKIGAEKNPDTGRHTFDILLLDICGVRVSVRHHFPATTRAYLEASQHSIQMGNAIIEAHRNSDTIPRIVVGAHRHRMGHYSDGKSLTVVTPAWQGLTRHGYKVVPDGRANPGMYLLDWRAKKDGELPDVHFTRYETPKSTAMTA